MVRVPFNLLVNRGFIYQGASIQKAVVGIERGGFLSGLFDLLDAGAQTSQISQTMSVGWMAAVRFGAQRKVRAPWIQGAG